jgi:dihydroorotate dehydrogenase
MYKKILKPIFFRFDPELMHDLFTLIGAGLGSNPFTRRIVAAVCSYEHPSLATRVAGIDFKNPIGLGAGFDKDMQLTKIMPSVGFGFMEVGAITHLPYEGNPKPRLARLPEDQSLIVYYGLKNAGATTAEKRLKKMKFAFPIGINIAKTNRADIKGKKSVEDYVMTYRMLSHYFNYVTLNVSCPNAQDGILFQDPVMLDTLLSAISKEKKECPVFLKISAHLSIEEVDAILAVVDRYSFVDGFVVSNLSKKRDILHLRSRKEKLDVVPEGGISGVPIKMLTTEMIRHMYKKTDGKYILIGLGGIFTAEDAYEKIKAGASLVQLVTGLIYEGPLMVKRVNRGLVALLARDGYATIADAVGKSA